MKRIHKEHAIVFAFIIFSSASLFAQNPTTTPSIPNDSSSSIRNPQSAIRNSLIVASSQNPDHFPYRDATLRVNNPTDKPVAAVRLRWRDGGPAMQFPLVIPPGGSAERVVHLPALSVSQTYDVELLPDDEFTAQPAGCLSTDIHWPVDLLTKDVFLDPAAWQDCYSPPPSWRTATKTTALFFGIIITLALTAVLLVRRTAVRLGIWTGVIVCSLAAGFVWILFFGGGVVRKVTLPEGLPGTLVQVRRTGEYYLRGIGPQNAPLYAHPDEIRDETLIVHPEKGLYLTLRPDETRIFLKRRERELHE